MDEFGEHNLVKQKLIEIKNNYFDVVVFSESFSSLKHNRMVFKEIQCKYSDIFLNISEFEFILLNDIETVINSIFCYCGKRKRRQARNCSRKCSANSEHFKNSVKKTKKERYGDENYNNMTKFKETCIQKYGSEFWMQNKEMADNFRDAINEQYGVSNVFQLEEIKNKALQTKKERYGDEKFNNKQKALQTKKERYGDEDYNNRAKNAETCLRKYGVDNVFKSEEIKKKIYEKNIELYGSKNVYQRHIKHLEDMNKEFIESKFSQNGFLLLDKFCEYFNCSVCHFYFILHKFDIKLPTKTNKHRTQSKIYKFISEHCGFEGVMDTKRVIKNREIDIFIPSKNLAIEYDGVMYHSTGNSNVARWNKHKENPKYHLSKTEDCKKLGIQLLHIFENEWIEKKEIWKSVIKNKLGLSEKLFARKCQLKEICFGDATKFLTDNHLQGKCSSSINIGLFHNEVLVSLMTFGKSRYNQNYEYELIRFCNKRNINVVGGASKILKHFITNYKPKSIISYANRRWSDGNLYRKIGFTEIGVTEPNYFYFDPKVLKMESRIKFQKHKLKDLLPVYNEELTETQNMYENGYRKIYDCGNYVFGWNDDC